MSQCIMYWPLFQAEIARKKVMKEGAECGNAVAAKALNLDQDVDAGTLWDSLQEAHFRPDGTGLRDLDLSMKGATDEIMNNIVK